MFVPIFWSIGNLLCKDLTYHSIYFFYKTITLWIIGSQEAVNQKLSYGPRVPIVSYVPFEKRGIDAIGPLPRTLSGKEYTIVAVDYMTRWAEVASTTRITAAEVGKIVSDYICSTFGTPLEILSDRGPSFRAKLLNDLPARLKIKHIHSTVRCIELRAAIVSTHILAQP